MSLMVSLAGVMVVNLKHVRTDDWFRDILKMSERTSASLGGALFEHSVRYVVGPCSPVDGRVQCSFSKN